MSFINVYYEKKRSKIHIWEEFNGKRLYDEIDWVPFLFERIKEEDQADAFTIDGIPVRRVNFKNFQQYKNYQNEKPNTPYIYENNVKPELQFLTERYYNIKDEDIEKPSLKVYSLDIETPSQDIDWNTQVLIDTNRYKTLREIESNFSRKEKENLQFYHQVRNTWLQYNLKYFDYGGGFPSADEAAHPIVLLTIYDCLKERAITFGIGEYYGNMENLYYIQCKNEKELLNKFFTFVHNHPPDIYTGWNVYEFDFTYIINRCRRIFGEDTKIYKKLSPISITNIWETKYNELKINIAGVNIVDYRDLYKRFGPKLESYKLDFVSNYELEEGKIDYSEYTNMKDFYYNDWDKFIEYNVIDTYRVHQIEQKKRFLDLIQTLCIVTRCPLTFFETVSVLIEGAFLTYFRQNNLCAPYYTDNTKKEYTAGHVKNPIRGFYGWLFSLDLTSSYPTAIITLNMSHETYFGKIAAKSDGVPFTEDEITYYAYYRNFPEFYMTNEYKTGKTHFEGKRLDNFNRALERKLMSVSPIGTVFMNSPSGFMANIEEILFNKRLETKNKIPLAENEQLKQHLNQLQNAYKTVINSIYGICATPYSRYYNIDIAEAIVSCGRQTLRSGEYYTNKLYNNISESPKLENLLTSLKQEFQ